MDVTITQKAIDDGVLRVWLRRIPVDSAVVFAFREDCLDEPPVSEAYIYGRGSGSSATQRVMLLFRLEQGEGDTPFLAGDKLRLRVKADGLEPYQDIELDVIEVE